MFSNIFTLLIAFPYYSGKTNIERDENQKTYPGYDVVCCCSYLDNNPDNNNLGHLHLA